MSQIRKVYADSMLSTPKTYSYAEWALFLKLLGEDESSNQYHKRAQENRQSDAGARSKGIEKDESSVRRQDADASGLEDDEKEKGGLTQWSWIGKNSPLMGDKD